MLERARKLLDKMDEEEAKAFAYVLCGYIHPQLMEHILNMQKFIVDNEYSKTLLDTMKKCESKEEAEEQLAKLVERMMFEYENH